MLGNVSREMHGLVNLPVKALFCCTGSGGRRIKGSKPNAPTLLDGYVTLASMSGFHEMELWLILLGGSVSKISIVETQSVQ